MPEASLGTGQPQAAARLAAQAVHSLLRCRLIWKKPASSRGVTASAWVSASRAAQRILCLRPTCQLSAGNADALVAAVGARVRAAVPAPRSVVLDLSATPVLHDGATPALDALADLLQHGQATLRLVLPGAKAQTAFFGDSATTAMGADTVHTSARAAMLAAYAALPGAAFLTPGLSQLLAQPPELLPVPDRPVPQ
jgi:hypothetical protein